MSEDALRFVSEKLLRSIGVDLSVKDMVDAAEIEQESLPKLKNALFQFLAYIIFANKTEARNWMKRASINEATDILRLIGFDPFLFNLDENPQHVLLTICWLIWRVDLFKTAYDPFLPDEDIKYLPPYSEYLTDPTITEPKPPRPPPEDHNELTKRIQRLFSKVQMELHELSDIEMQRETFNWKIRAIDQETSLYALSLKANVPLLTAHTDALMRCVRNSSKIQEIYRIEQLFWEWITPVANRPALDPSGFDDMRATPIDWYPLLEEAPYTRHNRCADELGALLNKAKTKLGNAKFAFGDLSRDRTLGGGYSLDIIRREIDNKMEQILRYEPMKKKETEKKGESLLPDMPFKDYSDTELTRIINQSEDRCDDVAASACPTIKEIAASIIEDTGLEMHGWEMEKFTRKRVTDDLDEVIPAEKVKLRAPKQTKAAKQKASRASLLGDLPKKMNETSKKTSDIPPPPVKSHPKATSSAKSSATSVASKMIVSKKKAVARKPRPEWNL